jgi:hypothetical protein
VIAGFPATAGRLTIEKERDAEAAIGNYRILLAGRKCFRVS